eukprot:6128654-Amphidinium_carterae.1
MEEPSLTKGSTKKARTSVHSTAVDIPPFLSSLRESGRQHMASHCISATEAASTRLVQWCQGRLVAQQLLGSSLAFGRKETYPAPADRSDAQLAHTLCDLLATSPKDDQPGSSGAQPLLFQLVAI